MPERADLLGLTAGGKDLQLHPQLDELLEALGFGVATTGLPLRYCPPGDPELVGQTSLRQADSGAQGQHQLREGIVSLMVHMSLHERSRFCVTRRSDTR